MKSTSTLDCNPIALINFLYRYSRQDYGAIFLYLPLPRRLVDRDAWTWLRVLKSMGAARKNWLVAANQTPVTLKGTHAHLFEPPPVCFRAYRLNQASLDKIFTRL